MSVLGKRLHAFTNPYVQLRTKRARTSQATFLRRSIRKRRVQSRKITHYNPKRYPLVNRLGTVFPTEYVTRVRYSVNWNNATVAPGIYDWILRGNSPYDPEFTIGGENSTGWTILSSIYDNYYVTGSTLEVSVLNNDDGGSSYMCYVVPRKDSTSIVAVDHDQFAGHPGSVFAANLTRDTGPTALRTSMSTRKILGGLLDSTCHAAVGANPAQGWYWHILTAPSGGASIDAQLVMAVTLTYTVHLYGLKNLDQAAL